MSRPPTLDDVFGVPEAQRLKRTLYPCPYCQATVLMRRWVMATTKEDEQEAGVTLDGKKKTRVPGHWEALDVPKSPLDGTDHDCPSKPKGVPWVQKNGAKPGNNGKGK